MSGDEWGPWIEHDGKGAPPGLVGFYARVVFESEPGEFSEAEGVVGADRAYSWDWHWWCRPAPDDGFLVARALRYRVRKPRGMKLLEELIADLPQPREVEPV